MVSALSGTELDAAAATALWQRTEGWPAGLQLAGLACGAVRIRARRRPGTRRRPAPVRLLHQRGAARSWPPSSATCLSAAAALDLLSGSLCDAALQVQGRRTYWRSWNAPTCSSSRLTPNASGIAVTGCCGRTASRTARPERGRDARGAAAGCALVRRARPDRRGGTPPAAWPGTARVRPRCCRPRTPGSSIGAGPRPILAHGERLAESAVEPQLALLMAYAAKISGHPRPDHSLARCL